MNHIRNIVFFIKKNGFFPTIKILYEKMCYRMTTAKKVARLEKNLPEIKKNRMLFHSHVEYGDNSRYLSDYLVDKGYLDKYEIIWLVSNPEKYTAEARKGIRFIQELEGESGLRTFEAYEAVLSAGYVFFTSALRWVEDRVRRPEQRYIDLWHGCGYKGKKGGRISFDYVLVPGEMFVDVKKEFFGCDRAQVLPLGYPRYDGLCAPVETDKVEKLLKKGNAKLVLWMPTFRNSVTADLNEKMDNGEFGLPIIRTEEQLREMNRFCRDNNIILALKRHPLQMQYHSLKPMSNIKMLDDNDFLQAQIRMYDFIGYSDALISDYSSISVDYLLLDKPIGFTLDDYEAYKEGRGFVFDNPLEFMPGAHLYDMEQMQDFLKQVAKGNDGWKQEREKVIHQMHNIPKNRQYCARIVDYFHL